MNAETVAELALNTLTDEMRGAHSFQRVLASAIVLGYDLGVRAIEQLASSPFRGMGIPHQMTPEEAEEFFNEINTMNEEPPF